QPSSTLFPYTTLFRSCRKETRIRDEEDLLHPGEMCRHRGNDLPRRNDRVDKKERGVRSGEDLPGAGENRVALEENLLRNELLFRSEEHTSELQSLAYL